MLNAKFDYAAATVFGVGVRLARVAGGETQRELGARCGLTERRVSFIERARCAVRRSERAALSVALPGLSDFVTVGRERKPIVQGEPAGAVAQKPGPAPQAA